LPPTLVGVRMKYTSQPPLLPPGSGLEGESKRGRPLGGSAGYLWAVALVSVATALSVAGREMLALPDIVMLYMLGIMVVAARFGRGASSFAAALSVASYDFFIIPPVFRFVVDDARHLLTFGTMFGVGVLISDLTSRVRRQELLAQREEMRSSLLSTVSHDLRTPLAGITGAATTLRDGPAQLSPEERADLVATICEEADRLERLVENLLDMTRLEFGGMVVKRVWTSLEELVVSALDRMQMKLDGRQVTVDLPADQVLVLVDPLLMGQVFVNLLDNAAKYTPPETPIEIRGRKTDGALEIEIADHGAGIELVLREKVFEKFFRGPHGGRPGAGLGLAICRGIVQAHGGSLIADGCTGGGAVFRLRLPVEGNAPPLPADPGAPDLLRGLQ
jgi:two-component system, OmpR family, sensor histidine kinase KdpD